VSRAVGGTGRVVGALATLTLVVGCSATGASGADGTGADSVETYASRLAPLKERSDVLEERFASVQGEGYTGPEKVREVLVEIIPEYAELLEETRDIEPRGDELAEAHEVLIASLERQQEGLELALRGMEADDSAALSDAALALEEAQELVEEHRSLLAEARG